MFLLPECGLLLLLSVLTTRLIAPDHFAAGIPTALREDLIALLGPAAVRVSRHRSRERAVSQNLIRRECGS